MVTVLYMLYSGVDDMLPIFSYIILRCGLPQMVSECSIMDEFIQEGYVYNIVLWININVSIVI